MVGCSSCCFWDRRKTRGDRAPCRVQPPEMEGGNDPLGSRFARWPLSLSDDWCGSHKPINTKAVAALVGEPEVI